MSQWKNSLFGCFSDITTCIFSFFIPCYQFGRNAEAIGESCMMYGLSQLVPIFDIYCRTMVRGKIREQKGIEGTCINDLLMHLCCAGCALAQESQELAAGGQSMTRE